MSEDLSKSSEYLDLSLGVLRAMSGPITQQARDRIDDEIASIHHSLSALRSRRNALSYACWLPPELLAVIFLHYARDWYTDPNSVHMGRVAPWVAVSYVCRTWRDAALDCAGLWAHLFFMSLGWTDEMLRRSKTAHLLICADLTSPYSYNTLVSLRTALWNMERIEEIRIRCSSVDSEIEDMLTAEAPLLRSLQISAVKAPLVSRVNRNFFKGVSPALRKVNLHGCYTDWSSPILNKLTHLSLAHRPCVSTVDFHGLIGALRRLPGLQELRLEGVLPQSNEISVGTATHAVVKVMLLHLEKITIVDEVSPVALLLSCLEIPLSTAVRLNFTCGSVFQCSGTLESFVSKRFSDGLTLLQTSNSSPPSLRSLDIYYQGMTGCRISCRVEEQGSKIRTPLEFTYITTKDHNSVPGRKTLIALCRILPLADLTKVTLHGDRFSHIDDCFWTEAFDRVPRLREIELDGGSAGASSLISALRTDVMFAPALRNITIKGISFRFLLEVQCKTDHPSQNPRRMPCIWCLRDALAGRANASAPLQRLSIRNCGHFMQDHVTGLQQVVWDLDLANGDSCRSQ